METIKFEIKDRFGNVLFTSNKHDNIKSALSEADLRWADLKGADLRRADLSEADLSKADLGNADLYEADLTGADLYDTRFYGKGGKIKLSKEQVPVFLQALGFIIED